MYTTKLKILRAYQLQLKYLGYTVVNGEVSDREVYRSLLRSGKQEKVKRTSDDRTFQNNIFLDGYFNNKGFLFTNPSYKELIKSIVTGNITKGKERYFKSISKISKLFLKLKYLEIFTLFDGQKIIKDNYHNKLYLYKDGVIYRLVSGKCIKYYK